MSEQKRAALIIKRATQLMAQGAARGWSDALEQARKQLNKRGTP